MEEGYWAIPKKVAVLQISEGAKIVYGILWTRKNGDNIAWPSRKYMAKQAGCSVRSVARYIDELKKISLIRTIRRGKKQSNIYIVNSDVPNMVYSDVPNMVTPQYDTNEKNKDSGILKKELPPSKNMNTYDENKFSDEYGVGEFDELGNPVQVLKEKQGMASYRLDAENLLKHYMALYNKEVGGAVPYWPKSAYLRQVKPVLAKYKLEKLKELLGAYFYRDDEITRGNKWSISCFLSWKMLIQLDA